MPTVQNSKYNFLNYAPIWFGLVIIVLAGSINSNNEMPSLKLSKQETALNINKNILKYLSAGNSKLLTDLLWVQTLIESDIEHYKGKDLNNWLYVRFMTIANLDPRFYENYLYGGQYLAIVKDDLEGASELYEKGLGVYPEDYNLNYHAGFLNYYEMGNYKDGVVYLNRIKNHPRAPVFITSIINKLLLETGTNIETIFELVKYNYLSTTDPQLKRRLEKDLYALKAEIDLDCLNTRGATCSQVDLEGKPYVLKDGVYQAKKEFLKYRINRIKKNSPPVYPEGQKRTRNR